MLTHRELYAVAHFGSSYEVMGKRELRAYLQEAKDWGFNAYSDWFDAADLRNPHNNPRGEYLLPQALWEHKLASFRAASDLGLRCSLVLTPNHVFLDQLRTEWLADTSGDARFFGQLLCPSIPEARAVMLRNLADLLTDLRAAGVQLDALAACPFDYGGCSCARCQPWIITFGELFAEMVSLAGHYYPAIKARLIGWWWSAEEERLFSAWAEKAHPNLFVSLARHIVYGEAKPAGAGTRPAGCEAHAFVHIGYADQAQPRDVYGTWGPVAAPARIENTVRDLEAGGYTGWMAYSEGQFDDLNKALLAGLSSGRYRSAAEALQAYAERYFGAAGAEGAAWAEWLRQWGSPWEVDVVAARRLFGKLTRNAQPGWRLSQWEYKLRLFEAHAQVLERPEWDSERLEAAERFGAAREDLQRRVWGLGRIRHALNERYFPPSWWSGYQAALGERADISLLPRSEA